MDLINFIIIYFSAKKLSLLTAFVCWSPESVVELSQRGRTAGLRVAAVRLQSPLGHVPTTPDMPAYRNHREAMLLDLTCPQADHILRKASSSRAFNLRHSWLLLHESMVNETLMQEILLNVAVLPDSDVVLLSAGVIVDVYRIKMNRPLILTNLLNDVPTSLRRLEKMWTELPTTVSRRKDLHNVYISSTIIMRCTDALLELRWLPIEECVGNPRLPSNQIPIAMKVTIRDYNFFGTFDRIALELTEGGFGPFFDEQILLTQPQHFRGWGDLSNRHVDTYPKFTYPLLAHAAEDLRFRMDLKQVELYGEERNGSFDGLAGLLAEGRTELGVASMFMRADRLPVLHFCSETVMLRGAFIFRQPARSAVSNVFLLPFTRGVWAAGVAVFAGAAALLALAGWLARLAPRTPHHEDLARLTLAECFTFGIGAICQQGSDLSPQLMSARLLMFCTLLASLFAFTSYSAKVVAILQAPSDAIQTIDDLTLSPMDLGVQETTYKKVYFADSSEILQGIFCPQESNEPATQRLYRRKLLPLGERAYLSVVDGVARLRTGLFAFQVEESSGYDIIDKTFTEGEKCGLKEIPAFTLPMVAVPLRRHSGLRDLLAARLRWQREVGIIGRYRRMWMSSRPRCGAQGGGFVSVGLRDVAPAAHILLVGTLLAAALAITERAVYALSNRRLRRVTIP